VIQVYADLAKESSAIETMSEILNANPTIRNASDLPSRRRQGDSHSSSKTPKGLFASTVPPSAYLPDPFAPHSSDSETSDNDEERIEPIDEQEIYGRIRLSSPHLPLAFPTTSPKPKQSIISRSILWLLYDPCARD